MQRFLPLLLALLISTVAPASAVDVTADDTTDAYLISGAVLLDAAFPEARAAATCSGCHWRIVRVCGAGAVEERSSCLGFPCPRLADIAEVWRADADALPPLGDPLWTYRGLICLATPPQPFASVVAAVPDLARRSVPPLRPAVQPTTTLTGLPTVFRSGQPAQVLAEPAVVSGVAVVVRAIPHWTWDFGHGALVTTSDPGAVWPAGRVRHTYPRRGIYRVRVTCSWTAVYSAGGLTDLPVDGVITQSAWFDLRVREARGFLRTSPGA